MKIHVEIHRAAIGNTDPARLREVTRMACLAWCLDQCGASVSIPNIPDLYPELPRWAFFRRLHRPCPSPDVLIVPSKNILTRPDSRAKLVCGFKASKGPQQDERHLGIFDLLIAHEFDVRLQHHEKMFVVPWGLHERTLQGVESDGLFESYLTNDLERIRSVYDAPIERKVGFCGVSLNGRGEMGERLSRANPGWFHFEWAPNQNSGESKIFGGGYIRWMRGCEALLHLPGDTPKTQRLCDAALAGRPIVYLPIPMREDPAVSDRNAIVLASLDDSATLPEKWEQRHALQKQADEDYRNGWSYMGQAQRLIRRLQEIL